MLHTYHRSNRAPPSPTRRTRDCRATAHRHARDVHHQRLRFHAPDRRRQQTRGRGEEIRRRPRRQGTHRLLVFHSSRSSRVRSASESSATSRDRTFPAPRGIRVAARCRRAPNARACAARNDGSIFFTFIPTATRPRFRARGRRARGERRRILGRSRVSPRFYPHARVRSAWVIPARRGARVAARRSLVPGRCVAKRSLSIVRSCVRSRASADRSATRADGWDASGLIDSRAHRERTTVYPPS